MEKLIDLGELAEVCAERRGKFKGIGPISLASETWAKILDQYQQISQSDSASVIGDHTIQITTSNGKAVWISVQELPQCWAIIPYYLAIREYEKATNRIAEISGVLRTASIWSELPATKWDLLSQSEDGRKIKAAIMEALPDEDQRDLYTKFLSNPTWSGVNKKLNRLDWASSAVTVTGNWLANAADRRSVLVAAISQLPEISTELSSAFESSDSKGSSELISIENPDTRSGELTAGENKLFYGPPGAGKSYKVDAESKGAITVRTVFHPDTQYSDFVGTLKPALEDSSSGHQITYGFSPGPFASALVAAVNNADKRVVLIIEELNRAQAAAVFGELFLLLDRKPNGESTYDCDFPTAEFANWYNRNVRAEVSSKKMRIPANLSIFATMNSADFGVFPLDTAFRRRWHSEYVPIDYSSGPEGTIELSTVSGNASVPWRAFAEGLNKFLLQEYDVPEDRLVGPWFVTDNELVANKLPGKLLIYLWDDLLRHEQRSKLFSDLIGSYGELHSRNDRGEVVFGRKFVSFLEDYMVRGTSRSDAEPATEQNSE